MTTQPLRVGPIARLRLERRARRDAENARPAAPGDAATPVTTPTIAALQARANHFAHREEQRFLARSRRELAEQRVLAQTLAADLDAYDDRLDELPPAERSAARIAEGTGTVFEELRRLRRRIVRGQRRSQELTASIHARFSAARLRALRTFDRSDEKIAVYWGAYRGLTAPAADRAPELHRSDWLTTRRSALELWRQDDPSGRTDVQA